MKGAFCVALQVGGLFLDAFQEIPDELTQVATEKYLRGTDDPVKIKDFIMELIADVVFCIPSVTVARGHRGESQRLHRRGALPPPNIQSPVSSRGQHCDRNNDNALCGSRAAGEESCTYQVCG